MFENSNNIHFYCYLMKKNIIKFKQLYLTVLIKHNTTLEINILSIIDSL